MQYASANTSYEEASYVYLGAPFEATTSFRKGTKFAPQRVRELSYGSESYHPEADVDVSEEGVHDAGDMDVWNDVEDWLSYADARLSDLVEDGKTPVVVGGEHTVSVAGARAADIDCFVVFDAHLDLKPEFQGERFSHACVSRRVHEEDVDVVIVGGRAGSREEYRYAERDGVTVLPADELDVDDLRSKTSGFDRPYVSVDVDVLDVGYAPDVGTPEAYGLSPHEVRDGIRTLASDAAAFDVVEARPSQDDASSAYAAAWLKDFLAYSAAEE